MKSDDKESKVKKLGESSVEVRYQDENIWLTQKMMAELYGVDRSVITKHLKKVFLDDELEENSVCAIFAHTASDEKIYKVKFYALQAVIAVGFKIDNQRAVQFRKWIIAIAKDYTIKGFVMDDERFKLGHKLTNQYFEEQLLIMTNQPRRQRNFLKKYRTNYIMPFIDTPSRNNFGGSRCSSKEYGIDLLEIGTRRENSKVRCFHCKKLSDGKRN